MVEENHSYGELTDPSAAPFLSSVLSRAAVLTQSYAVAHPSQPNYLALFSGSTQGVSSDACPQTFGASNLGHELIAAGRTFAGYSEDLPGPGYTGCSTGSYARKHNPWSDFTDLPASVNQPLTAFPADYSRLPTVSFVIPNEMHDMHSASVTAGDRWLQDHLAGYLAWAGSHDSLLIVTADEDDYSSDNRILTLIAGAYVHPGRYSQHVDHYGLLRTLEAMYGLPALGHSAQAAPLTGMWMA